MKAIEIRENVPLAPLTTLGVGGPARCFVDVTDKTQLPAVLSCARDRGLAVFILGGGSNIVVADEGFDGLVVRIRIEGITRRPRGGLAHVTVGAGENWDSFVDDCVAQDLAGVECLSGIPGTVGGTPIQNVGAYGQDVADTILEVECLDRESLDVVEFSNAECEFSYRSSIFNRERRNRYAVLSVTFQLERERAAKVVAYRDLVERFGDKNPSLAEVRAAVLDIRRAKSMVIDADDPNSKSAGSFFKNPIVSAAKLAGLQDRFPQIVSFPSGNAAKLSAAWLIENAGFHKGYTLGRVGISTNHSLALVNQGGAKASEIIELKDRVQAAVREKFGIDLIPEPLFVGFESSAIISV